LQSPADINRRAKNGPPPATATAPVEVAAVRTRTDLARFIDLPWRIYRAEPGSKWIPPLRLMVRDTLDIRKNPFWRNADRELFLVLRDGEVVGRIAAIENRAHNDFHSDRVGFFGFLECFDDPEAAAALFDAAERWLRDRGLDTMRGPISPSTNHECGLLVQGFRWEPTFLTPWNPRYYAQLCEGAGLAKSKDLLAYFIPMASPRFSLPESYQAHASRALERSGLTFRDMDLDDYATEIERWWEVYNTAWERNWGFVPMTKEEFLFMGKELKPLILRQFAFVAEKDGEIAGFMLVIPDYNQIFKRIPSGRLLPTGIFKLLLGKSRLRSGRTILLGIRPEYRGRSIYELFVHEAVRRGREYGAVGAEASWILEDNDQMNRPLVRMGVKAYRRWRIYDRPIPPAARPAKAGDTP
jgi:GNAT superfamily N-acetyltransferase